MMRMSRARQYRRSRCHCCMKTNWRNRARSMRSPRRSAASRSAPGSRHFRSSGHRLQGSPPRSDRMAEKRAKSSSHQAWSRQNLSKSRRSLTCANRSYARSKSRSLNGTTRAKSTCPFRKPFRTAEVLRLEEPVVRQQLRADQERVLRERGDAVVGVGIDRRVQGEDLPVRLPGRRQEVGEPVRRGPEVPDPEPRRQRRDMQEQPAPPYHHGLTAPA